MIKDDPQDRPGQWGPCHRLGGKRLAEGCVWKRDARAPQVRLRHDVPRAEG